MKNIIIFSIIFVLVVGCANLTSDEITDHTKRSFGRKKDTLKSLESVEIRNYKGEKLNSVSDFRENSIKGPQYIKVSDYQLEISGLVEEPSYYSYNEILSFPSYSKVVTLYCVEGWDVTILWEGILLKDILEEVKVDSEANNVVFYAYDGYSSSLPLNYILDNNIIIAYKMNNVTLPPERGFPFQLVAEDKWGYKWVKWITKIELSNDPNFKGYWERRGYHNDGDVGGPIYEKN